MLSDLKWKRATVRAETQCSRCSRKLLAGQQSIQIDRARVCISCWDEVRVDTSLSEQEYKREFGVARAAAAPRRSSGSGSRPRRAPAALEQKLSPYDATLLVGNELDRQAESTRAEVISARDLPFAEPGFDYLVIGPAGVTIVGSAMYSSIVEIEALVGWASTSIPPNLRINGRERRELIDRAVALRDQLSALIEKASLKFDVPVGAALCFENVIGVDRTPVRDVLGVHVETAPKVAEYCLRRGPLFEDEIAEVTALLKGAD